MKKFIVRFVRKSTGKAGKRTVFARDREEAVARVSSSADGTIWHYAFHAN